MGGGRGGGIGSLFGSVRAPRWRSGLTECRSRDKAAEEKETGKKPGTGPSHAGFCCLMSEFLS